MSCAKRNIFVRGFDEISPVICSSFLALIGLGLAAYGVMEYEKRGGDNTVYKKTYMIYRPCDPRTRFLRRPVRTKCSFYEDFMREQEELEKKAKLNPSSVPKKKGEEEKCVEPYGFGRRIDSC